MAEYDLDRWKVPDLTKRYEFGFRTGYVKFA